MIHNSTHHVNKNFKNFFSKIFLTFPSRYAIHARTRITHTHLHTYTRHTPIHTFLCFLSFSVSCFLSFSFSFFRLFPSFLLKPPKIVHSCVSFPFPSQYTTFSLERNHERFFAVLCDFTNAFKSFPHKNRLKLQILHPQAHQYNKCN